MSETPTTPEPGPRPWRRGMASPTSPDEKSALFSARRRQLYLVLAGFVVVAGTFLGWFFLPRWFRDPFFLTIPITEYSDPGLPLNPWAHQDSDLLLTHFPQNRRHKVFHCQQRHTFLEELKKIERTDAPAVIVHLRAHAHHHEGKVFLLPGDARLDQPDTWVSLEDILKAMGHVPTLLILDVMQPKAEVPLGVFGDDIATPLHAALRRELETSEQPLLVLCACSPGETALVSEELGLSLLAYYLDEGLRGPADGAVAGSVPNGRISAKELGEFVSQRVSRWARRVRAVEQKPVLLGRGADFDLVSLATERPKVHAPREQETFPQWLRDGWKIRDDWWWAGEVYLRPFAYRRVEDMVHTAEQRWRAGVPDSVVRKDLQGNLDIILGQSRLPREEPLPELSIALARANGLIADETLDREMEDILVRLEKTKPEERDKLAGDRDKVLALVKGRHLHLGAAAVRAAELAPRAERFLLLEEMLRGSSRLDQVAEVRFLRQLATLRAGLKKSDADRLPPELFAGAYRAVLRYEQAKVFDPRVLGWAEKPFAALTARWNDATRPLLKGSSTTWPLAQDQLARLAGDAERFGHTTAGLKEAYDLSDFAHALLPASIPYLLARAPEESKGLLTTWEDAARALRELETALADPQWGKAAAVEELRQRLLRLCAELWPPLTGVGIRQLVKRVEGEVETLGWRELEAVLASPWPTGPNREAVWQKARQLGRQSHQRVHALDQNSGPAIRAADSTAPPRPDEATMIASRARLSLGLLRLTGVGDVVTLEDDLEKTLRAPDSARWATIQTRLRGAWLEQVPARLRTVQHDPAVADRLTRLIPLVEGVLSSQGGEPAMARRQHEASVYRRWLDELRRAESTVAQ